MVDEVFGMPPKRVEFNYFRGAYWKRLLFKKLG
jgi:hypothetical protein